LQQRQVSQRLAAACQARLARQGLHANIHVLDDATAPQAGAALAAGTSTLLLPQITDHVQTNVWLVETMLGARTRLAGHRLSIEGIGYVAPAPPPQAMARHG
jgi:RNA 3'-terminal phosphate cyclase (ATP)